MTAAEIERIRKSNRQLFVIVIAALVLAGTACFFASSLLKYVFGYGGSVEHLPINQQQAAAALRAKGAWLRIDGDVIEVDLSCSSTHGNYSRTDSDLQHLRVFPKLKSIQLHYCKAITDDGMKEVAAVKRLEGLDLLGTNITDEGLSHLSRQTELTGVGFGKTSITDDGLTHLSKMTNLTWIGLHNCKNITGVGIRHIPNLHKLTVISAGDTQFSDAGLKILSNATNIEYLYLSNSNISDNGLSHIEGLTKLKRVYLSGTKVTRNGKVKWLRALQRNGHSGRIVVVGP